MMNSFLVGGGEPRTEFSSMPKGSSPTSSVSVEFIALRNNRSLCYVAVGGCNIRIFLQICWPVSGGGGEGNPKLAAEHNGGKVVGSS